MLSSLCRGTTVTSSISHRKATSEGTSPEGRGKAIFENYSCGFSGRVCEWCNGALWCPSSVFQIHPTMAFSSIKSSSGPRTTYPGATNHSTATFITKISTY